MAVCGGVFGHGSGWPWRGLCLLFHYYYFLFVYFCSVFEFFFLLFQRCYGLELANGFVVKSFLPGVNVKFGGCFGLCISVFVFM